MKKILVRASRKYPVVISKSIQNLPAVFKFYPGQKILLISSPKIYQLYGEQLLQTLPETTQKKFCLISDAEKDKNLTSVEKIYHRAVKFNLERTSLVLGLGGGVITDITGFFAATFLRGINWIALPTTLLAQVDAAIGGKTGVNLAEGKNLVGAFYQPQLVYCNLSYLKTLPEKEIKNAFGEIIKYAIIAQSPIRKLLEKYSLKQLTQPELLAELVYHSVKIKAKVVEQDEYEQKNLREILNLGHTFGHILETLGKYQKISHGEAVAAGILAATELSRRLKICSTSFFKECTYLIKKLGFKEVKIRQTERKNFSKILLRDKKIKQGKIRLVLPVNWGKVKIVSDIDPKKILEVI